MNSSQKIGGITWKALLSMSDAHPHAILIYYGIKKASGYLKQYFALMWQA